MKVQSAAISLALFLVTSAGMAADPPSPTASANAVTAAAAAAAPIGPTVVPTTDAAATAKAAHALGLVQRQRKGKTVYCKSDAALGTRFASMTCYTPEEVSAVQLRNIGNSESVAAMQRTQ